MVLSTLFPLDSRKDAIKSLHMRTTEQENWKQKKTHSSKSGNKFLICSILSADIVCVDSTGFLPHALKFVQIFHSERNL